MQNLVTQKLLFATKQAMLKITEASEFEVGKKTTASTKINAGDELLSIIKMSEGGTVVMETEKRMFARISVDDIPMTKKASAGVHGMKLSKDDKLSAVYYLSPDDTEKQTSSDGLVALERLHITGRGTKGVKR